MKVKIVSKYILKLELVKSLSVLHMGNFEHCHVYIFFFFFQTFGKVWVTTDILVCLHFQSFLNYKSIRKELLKNFEFPTTNFELDAWERKCIRQNMPIKKSTRVENTSLNQSSVNVSTHNFRQDLTKSKFWIIFINFVFTSWLVLFNMTATAIFSSSSPILENWSFIKRSPARGSVIDSFHSLVELGQSDSAKMLCSVCLVQKNLDCV